VLAPAAESSAPISPNVPQIIIFGALLGFILSCILIYSLEYIDDTIKDAEDSARIIGKPLGGADEIWHRVT
jgi:capsular polysaccharide biosynthesis protein